MPELSGGELVVEYAIRENVPYIVGLSGQALVSIWTSTDAIRADRAVSGGEQQMLAIGRALAMRPRLLMLDEPSLGLAPIVVQSIFTTIRDINARGVTVLLVEQNVKQALGLAQRAYVLENGEIIMAGAAAAVADDDHVRRAYLGI